MKLTKTEYKKLEKLMPKVRKSAKISNYKSTRIMPHIMEYSGNQLLGFYSALLYFHQHDTKNIVGYLHTVDNGKNYIELINKNVLNLPKNMINSGNKNLKNSFNDQLPI